MTYAQKMYLDTNQREFALGFKDLAPFLKDELNLIHTIQLCSNELKNENSKHNRSEVLKRMEDALSKYEREYGPYELNHYRITENKTAVQMKLF